MVDNAAGDMDAAIGVVAVQVSAGWGTNEILSVATSDNTELIPHPMVNYTSPQVTGSLSYTPVPGKRRWANITVTVTDAGPDGDLGTSADNESFSQTFLVTVYNSPTAEIDEYKDIPANSVDAVAARIAAHYERADEPEEAIEYYQRAVEVALRVQCEEDVIRYRQRASALLEQSSAGES